MKRRDFLKTDTIGITAPSVIFGDSKINTNKNDPIILSTWEHGLPANDAAWKTLQNGGNAMAAAEAGARVPEADPKSTSVGFGGLPDEKGNVTLDACVMDSTGNAGSVAFLQNIKHPVSVVCEEALNRVIKRHNGNPDFQISYIAIRKDGEIGSVCIKWSFEYALARGGANKRHKIKGMI